MNHHESGSAALPEQESEFRHRLAVCLTAARAYDGTERGYNTVLAQIEEFEKWEFAAFGHQFADSHATRLSESAEHALLARHHPTLAAEARTISGLLALTVKHCSDRVQRGDEAILKVRTQFMDGTLLPTGRGELQPSQGKEPFVKEAIFSPRLRTLLAGLQEKGIYFDDVLIWVGDPPQDALKREKPYVLVEIPRLQGSQVLVCDQLGEVTFVMTEHLDPKILFEKSKEGLLREYPDSVKKVVWKDEKVWQAEIVEWLFLQREPGQKIDIALREALRQSMMKEHAPEEFFDKEGALVVERVAKLQIGDRKIGALVDAFGIDYERRRGISGLVAIRFLEAVYGREHPFIDATSKMEERDQALQTVLGKDPNKWAKFLQGEPVQVKVLGKMEAVTCDPCFKTREDFLTFGGTQLESATFGGLGLVALSYLLLSGGVKGAVSKHLARSPLGRQMMAEVIFGSDEKTRASIDRLRKEQALREWLGDDAEKWRRFMQGEPVAIDMDGAAESVRAERAIPSVEEIIRLDSVSNFLKYRFAGWSISRICREIFAKEDPQLASKRHALHTRLDIFRFARLLYQDERVEKRYRMEQEHQAARTHLGRDKQKWRDFIRGEPLVLDVEGEKRTIVVEQAFHSPEEIMAIHVRDFFALKFAGLAFVAMLGILLPEQETGTKGVDPRQSSDALAQFARAIFPSSERLSPATDVVEVRLQEARLQKAVIAVLGDPKNPKDPKASKEAWARFIRGEEVQVMIDGKSIVVKAEKAFSSKEEFLALPLRERRALRFAGYGLSALTATLLGESGLGHQAYLGAKYQAIAEAVFPEGEARADHAKTPPRS